MNEPDDVPDDSQPLDGLVGTDIDDDGNVTAYFLDERMPPMETQARTVEEACFQLGVLFALHYPERLQVHDGPVETIAIDPDAEPLDDDDEDTEEAEPPPLPAQRPSKKEWH